MRAVAAQTACEATYAPRFSIAIWYSRPARYEERTSGPGHHTGEADLLGLLLQLHELVRLHPALHGVVAHGGPQVLRDGDQLAARVVQLAAAPR